jgi:hypothetical protein
MYTSTFRWQERMYIHSNITMTYIAYTVYAPQPARITDNQGT